MNRPLVSYPNENVLLSGWRRTAFLITLVLVSIFSQIDRVLPFILGESIKLDLGLNDTQLGLLTGVAFSICYSLASLPLARIADKGWAKQVLVLCLLLWSAMTVLGGLAFGFVLLAFSRFGVALGEAGGTSASHAMIVDRIPAAFRGRAIGLFAMGIPLGTMIGFALGGWISDHLGWRYAFIGAGIIGLLVVLLVLLFAKGNYGMLQAKANDEGFLVSAKKLFSKPSFVWLFIVANLLGFATAPFYTFTAPFLIRTHGLTVSEVGLSFGLLQGLMGILGTLLGGRWFDRAVNRGSTKLMNPPAMVLMIAAVSTMLGLFAPSSFMGIALFVPAMFAFAFLLPFAFGSGHMAAGPGKEALATGIFMMGAGMLSAAISPLLVGMISDAASTEPGSNGLRIGMLVVPLFCVFSSVGCFIASDKLSVYLKIGMNKKKE
ncbi:MFS transporter [Flagellimonas abyssi]|uniref:MFS transporter n=1 Tax=Flagellimonas abyssi TaxID=2864871 RepID=A0ABS7EVU5_9FLAO|nr:MFS transporter [Allomuricauda abyssi]MBW8201741.1 MFS transporter [Allomuricauda abyssi]